MIDFYPTRCTQCGDIAPQYADRKNAQAFLTMHRILHTLGADRQAISQAMFAHEEATR